MHEEALNKAAIAREAKDKVARNDNVRMNQRLLIRVLKYLDLPPPRSRGKLGGGGWCAHPMDFALPSPCMGRARYFSNLPYPP